MLSRHGDVWKGLAADVVLSMWRFCPQDQEAVNRAAAERIMGRLSDTCREQVSRSLGQQEGEEATEVSDECRTQFESAVKIEQEAAGQDAAAAAPESNHLVHPVVVIMLFLVTVVAGIAYYVHQQVQQGNVKEFRKNLSKKKQRKLMAKGQ